MKKRLIAIMMTAVLTLQLCACANAGKTETAEEPKETTAAEAEEQEETTAEVKEEEPAMIEAPHIAKEDFPVMDGSTANLPLARMLYRLCTGTDEFTAQENVSFTTTNNCYMRLMNGDAEIVIAYEAGPDAKADDRFANLDIKPIGLDALVFLANEGNSVESLTEEQLQDIYTGKVTNWKELGGEDIEIIPFQRTLNSGSQTLMQNLVLRDKQFMDAPTELRPGEMGDLLDFVAEYNNKKNAIGYSVYYYVNNMYMLPGIRLMKVNGVMPDNDTIRSGEYQYVNPFYVAVRKDMDKECNAYKMFDWLTTDDGQSLIDETGYVSKDGGSKKLSDEYINDTIDFKTSTPFAINGNLFDEMSGVVVFGENLKPVKRYPDIRVAEGDYEVMYSDLIAAELPMEYEHNPDGNEDYYVKRSIGLFNVKTGEWEVKPEYQSVYFDFSDPGNVTFVLEYPENEREWDSGGRIDYFDKSGVMTNSVRYNNGDEKWKYVDKYEFYNYDDRDILEEDKETIKLGGDSRFVRYYSDEEKAELYIDGELVTTMSYGHVFPYQAAEFRPSQLPYGWTRVNMISFDSDWNTVDAADYIIDENGALVAGFKTSSEEYLLFNARDYAVFSNATGYEIVDMKADKIYSWRTPAHEYE